MLDMDEVRNRKMKALGMLEDGALPGLDYSVSTPTGEAQVTRQPLRPADPDNLPVSAPVSSLHQSGFGADTFHSNPAGIRDSELEDAVNLDQQARSDRLLETATRQLIGGLTRTAPQATLTEKQDNVGKLKTQRRSDMMESLKALEIGNEEKRFDFAKSEAARKEALDAQHRKEDLDERKIDNERGDMNMRMMGGLMGEKNAINREGLGIRREAQDIKTNALQPRDGWEPIQQGAPTFRAEAEAAKFDAATAAFGALQNHRAHAGEALKRLRAAKTPTEADTALAEVNQQMANIAAKLRVAEGLNSSDASNQAVDTMLSLSHGSIANLRNFANEGRLDAILDSSINSARTNLDTMATSNNLRRTKAKAAEAPVMDAAPQSPEDEKALAWAKANPKDPRAAAILQRLGAK